MAKTRTQRNPKRGRPTHGRKTRAIARKATSTVAGRHDLTRAAGGHEAHGPTVKRSFNLAKPVRLILEEVSRTTGWTQQKAATWLIEVGFMSLAGNAKGTEAARGLYAAQKRVHGTEQAAGRQISKARETLAQIPDAI